MIMRKRDYQNSDYIPHDKEQNNHENPIHLNQHLDQQEDTSHDHDHPFYIIPLKGSIQHPSEQVGIYEHEKQRMYYQLPDIRSYKLVHIRDTSTHHI